MDHSFYVNSPTVQSAGYSAYETYSLGGIQSTAVGQGLGEPPPRKPGNEPELTGMSSKRVILIFGAITLTVLGIIATLVFCVFSEARLQKHLQMNKETSADEIADLKKNLSYIERTTATEIADLKKNIIHIERTTANEIADLKKSLGHIERTTANVRPYSEIKDLKKNLSNIQRTTANEIAEVTKNPSYIPWILEKVEDACKRRGGLHHSGKCFTTRVSSSQNMTYEEAVAECVKHGAQLAEIHNRAQQTHLYDFALTKMPAGRSLVYVWLGMEYKSSDSTLLYRSGMEKDSNQLQWDEDYPSSYSSDKYMAIEVGDDGDSKIGIWNLGKLSLMHGVICEKDTTTDTTTEEMPTTKS